MCRILSGWFVFFIMLEVFLCAAQEPADTNYDEAEVPDYALPALLIDESGNAVGRSEWLGYRRNEILQLLSSSVYGKTPEKQLKVRYELVEQDHNALEGRATRKQIAAYYGEASYRIDILLYFPNSVSGPSPTFLGLNFSGNHTIHPDQGILKRGTSKQRGAFASRWQLETLMERGYALATVHRDQIDPDNYRHNFSDGIHPLFYDGDQVVPKADEWGAIGAWAWGLSRVLDWLETEESVDEKRVAVIGHSRLGKTALWAGAQDRRFAMVVSNNSGCGGAALYRRCYGERIHHMLKPVGYWFCRNHHQYQKQEHMLPVDQHMLLALVAPRPLYVASATNDRWADPRGEYLAARHASQVYELMGWRGLGDEEFPKAGVPIHTRIGYHLRTGDHDLTAFDWQQYLAFADQHLKPE
jgi:hypothetical protein